MKFPLRSLTTFLLAGSAVLAQAMTASPDVFRQVPGSSAGSALQSPAHLRTPSPATRSTIDSDPIGPLSSLGQPDLYRPVRTLIAQPARVWLANGEIRFCVPAQSGSARCSRPPLRRQREVLVFGPDSPSLGWLTSREYVQQVTGRPDPQILETLVDAQGRIVIRYR